MKFGKGNIENIDINKMTQNDILKMYEIERDTWSHFMGEYVKCNDCNISYSKSDIYGKVNKDYNLKTVTELENEYGRNNIKCTCCGSETIDIRGEELITILESRIFTSKQGFVNFYKSNVDKILGFSYGFIDSPINTYEKEFSYHFSEKLLDKFIKNFGNNDLITLSGVCTRPEISNIQNIYELVKSFYCSIDYENDHLVSIGEAVLGSPSYKIYDKMLPNTFNVKENKELMLHPDEPVYSDIVFGEKTARRFQKVKNMDIKNFLRYTKNITKDILVT